MPDEHPPGTPPPPAWPPPASPAPSAPPAWPTPASGQWPPPANSGQWAPPASSDQAAPPHVPPPSGQPYGSAPQPSRGPSPAWLQADWDLALRVAGIGVGVVIGVGFAIALVEQLQIVMQFGAGAAGILGLVLTTLRVALAWIGGTTGSLVVLTGLVAFYLSFRLALKAVPPARLQVVASDPVRLLAVGAKIGLFVAIFAVGAGILALLIERTTVSAFSLALLSPANLATTVFFGLTVQAAIGVFAVVRHTGSTLRERIGLGDAIPIWMIAGLAGARRTVIVAGGAMLSLYLAGSALSSLAAFDRGFGQGVQEILSLLQYSLFSAVDAAMLLIIGAARFLTNGGELWATHFRGPWVLLAIPILAGAYVTGALYATRRARAASQLDAIVASLLIGPGVAAATAVTALITGASLSRLAVAIILPALWGIVAVLTAWLWSLSQQLPASEAAARTATASANRATPPPAHGSPIPSSDLRDLPPPSSTDRRPPP